MQKGWSTTRARVYTKPGINGGNDLVPSITGGTPNPYGGHIMYFFFVLYVQNDQNWNLEFMAGLYCSSYWPPSMKNLMLAQCFALSCSMANQFHTVLAVVGMEAVKAPMCFLGSCIFKQMLYWWPIDQSLRCPTGQYITSSTRGGLFPRMHCSNLRA